MNINRPETSLYRPIRNSFLLRVTDSKLVGLFMVIKHLCVDSMQGIADWHATLCAHWLILYRANTAETSFKITDNWNY